MLLQEKKWGENDSDINEIYHLMYFWSTKIKLIVLLNSPSK